jgi:amidase/aspartyl-tRNA(Asn)/glutamyl-tRNA(Gln) amidotransferase subunit A
MPDRPPATPLDNAPELCRLSATELTTRYADGSLSPVEATLAALDRAARVQEKFNTFTHLDHEAALAAARAAEARWHKGAPASAIDGVPTTIKDIVWVRGWTVHYGTTAVPGVDAAEDAPTVALLRAAGAVLLGLTTTPEFGWKALTDSAFSGITRNPWNPDRTPGGSSGGAAVAAASGAGVLHLGTDGGGSIRIPCGFTGLVGHKPTFGRVPAYPASPFGTVAHIGPMARGVADASLMLDAMSGRDTRDWYQSPLAYPPTSPVRPRGFAGLRVGVWDTPPRGAVAPDVRQAFDAALARLSDAGAVLHPVTLPGGDLWALFNAHWYTGAATRLRAIPAERLGEVETGLREVAELGSRYSATDLVQAQTARAQFGGAFDRLFADLDVIVSPVVAVTGFAVGHEVPPGSGLSRWTEWAGFSYPINLAQAPACVVPCGFGDAAMPVGLQFVGRRGDDAGVLAAAAAFEHLGT